MPCTHSVCLHCFKRTVELTSLCCPLCRLRVSSWARKQSREKSLVNTELWEMVRQTYPETCRRRIEQRDGGPAVGDIFSSPTQLFKAGEMRRENEKPKRKMTDEETEERKKKLSHHKKEECELLHFQDTTLGVLSDSENEEPMRMRTRHVSAFVRKTRFSPAFNRGFPNSIVQRSQSCTDSEEGRGKIRAHSHLSAPEKATIAHSYNAGILLSSENSRSFSAPVLPLDKRHNWRSILASPATSLVPHVKPERSISPESNDSISEELNHFKPIVCSPCTPPKRLPDGRLMEPTIVKSTPRNLTHSLQKTTSYEASPTILQKWKQIEIDRQCIKVMSKGTITSPVVDCLAVKQSCGEERGGKSSVLLEKGTRGQHCSCDANTDGYENRRGKSLVRNRRWLSFDHCSKERDAPLTCDSSDTRKRCGACETHCAPSEHRENYKSPMIKRSAGESYNHSTEEPQDSRHENAVRSCVFNRPTSRRGKKRSQKSKHLEETGKTKISRTEICDAFETQCGRSDLCAEKMCQEKKDRDLALKLQRQFDKEWQVERHKAGSDKYFLRSWVSVDDSPVLNPRRSGRTSRRIKHFN